MKKNIINLNIDIITEGLKDSRIDIENKLYWENEKRRLIEIVKIYK